MICAVIFSSPGALIRFYSVAWRVVVWDIFLGWQPLVWVRLDGTLECRRQYLLYEQTGCDFQAVLLCWTACIDRFQAKRKGNLAHIVQWAYDIFYFFSLVFAIVDCHSVLRSEKKIFISFDNVFNETTKNAKGMLIYINSFDVREHSFVYMFLTLVPFCHIFRFL